MVKCVLRWVEVGVLMMRLHSLLESSPVAQLWVGLGQQVWFTERALFRCRTDRHPTSAKREGGEWREWERSGLVRGTWAYQGAAKKIWVVLVCRTK